MTNSTRVEVTVTVGTKLTLVERWGAAVEVGRTDELAAVVLMMVPPCGAVLYFGEARVEERGESTVELARENNGLRARRDESGAKEDS